MNITLNFDIRVLFSEDKDCTASIIKKIYSMKNLGYAKNTARRNTVYHAVKFFGISRKRLEALFSNFGSISSMAKADKKDFKEIKSIGRKTMENVKNVLESNIFE